MYLIIKGVNNIHETRVNTFIKMLKDVGMTMPKCTGTHLKHYGYFSPCMIVSVTLTTVRNTQVL